MVNPANMDGCVSARGFNATDDDSSCPSFPTLLVLLLLLGSPDMKLNADGAAVDWDGGSAGVVVKLLAATVISGVAGVEDGDGEDVDEPMDDCKNEKPLELAAGGGEGEDFSSPSPFIDRPPNMADVVLLTCG